MITKEANEWIRKVERGQYTYETAMCEFAAIAKYLTREEVNMLLARLKKTL